MKSPSIPTKDDVVAEFRRRSLIAAALEVFGEHGFELATMDAIAEAAHVAKGTLYLYYDSKQAIYDATVAAGLGEIERLSIDRMAHTPTIRQAIQAFIGARIEYFQKHPKFFRIYVAEIAKRVATSSPPRSACHRSLERQAKALQIVIERAVESGEIRSVDAEAAALAIFDISKGLVGRRLMNGSTSSARRDIEFLTELIWTGLKPSRGQKK